MDQEKLADLLQDKVLKALPDEALDEILALPDDGQDHSVEAAEIIKRYGIDLESAAKTIISGEQK